MFSYKSKPKKHKFYVAGISLENDFAEGSKQEICERLVELIPKIVTDAEKKLGKIASL